MIREIAQCPTDPRRSDGRLWCGHTEQDIVYDENQVSVCHVCSGIMKPKLEREPMTGVDETMLTKFIASTRLVGEA